MYNPAPITYWNAAFMVFITAPFVLYVVFSGKVFFWIGLVFYALVGAIISSLVYYVGNTIYEVAEGALEGFKQTWFKKKKRISPRQ